MELPGLDFQASRLQLPGLDFQASRLDFRASGTRFQYYFKITGRKICPPKMQGLESVLAGFEESFGLMLGGIWEDFVLTDFTPHV